MKPITREGALANASKTQALLNQNPRVLQRDEERKDVLHSSSPVLELYSPQSLRTQAIQNNHFIENSQHERTINLIKQAYEYMQNDYYDREIVLVCGDTGAGKSTVVNYLLNKPIYACEQSNSRMLLINCDDPITPIGHEAISQTAIPTRCTVDTSFVYYDCPGFEDTNGPEVDIANAYSITKVKAKAENIKILALVEESSITGARRGQAFRDMIIKMHLMFPNNKNLADNVTFCFTKAYNIRDFRQELSRISETRSELNADHRKFLQKIIRNEQFVVFHQPTELGNISDLYRNELLGKISSASQLVQPNIDPVISPKSLPYLAELAAYTNDRARHAINNIIHEVTRILPESAISSQDLASFAEVCINLTQIQYLTDREAIENLKHMINSTKDMALHLNHEIIDTELSTITFYAEEMFEGLFAKFLPGQFAKFDEFTWLEPYGNLLMQIKDEAHNRGIRELETQIQLALDAD